MLEVGQRVKTKSAKTLMQEYGGAAGRFIRKESGFTYDMWYYCSKEATIVKIEEKSHISPYTCYKLRFDGAENVNIYDWNEYMFVPVNKQEYAPIDIEEILC